MEKETNSPEAGDKKTIKQKKKENPDIMVQRYSMC
jgi:hypothetical protein